MADAILSEAAGQIFSLLRDQTVYHVNLVRGAEEEVRSLAEKLQALRINFLDDAENRRFKDKHVNYWLSKLEQRSYEMEDVLDEWRYAILKLQMKAAKQKVLSCIPSPSCCLCFKKAVVRHKIAEKILNIKAQLDGILKEKEKYSFLVSDQPKSWRIESTSSVDLGEVYGRERERDVLVGMLVDNKLDQSSCIQIVPVVGVGGLGKTTLAQLVYNHIRVKETFDLRIWICVSHPFDLIAIAKGILESIEKGSSSGTDNLEILLNRVEEGVSGKRFLLVFDDVWTENSDEWKPLKNKLLCGGHGSKILVTTRNEEVVRMMGLLREEDMFRPGKLSDEDCWLLLSRIALVESNIRVFEDIGKSIAKKCNGLPLATKTLGSLLHFRRTVQEWEEVLNSEIWELKEAELHLFPHLLLSYNELSPTLKRCFSYCAVFPKDTVINVESLIEDWIALGYLGPNIGEMELKGRHMFNVIVTRSLFQDFRRKDNSEEIESFKMHDIVHDFARFVRRSSRVEATTCESCDPLLVSSVNEFCSFITYDNSPVILCDCLLRLRVLRLFRSCSRMFINTPQGIEKLIHLRLLRMFKICELSGEGIKKISLLYNLETLSVKCCNKLIEIPKEIENLINLRHLNLSHNRSLKGVPSEIGNLKELRHLDLSYNRCLKGFPSEIGNLKKLRHLDLSYNRSLEGVPSEIGNLMELRHLDLKCNYVLRDLPESICGLKKLRTLKIGDCRKLILPEKLAHQTGLECLDEIKGGSGRNKLGLMKELIHLSGCLKLRIRLAGGGEFEKVVEDAGEAELRNKTRLEELEIEFKEEMDETESRSCRWMELVEALEPHPNLQKLSIYQYEGVKFPEGWMVSPLNRLREFKLDSCDRLTSLPCLGMLPYLEQIYMSGMKGLQFVGREFLGITNTPTCVAFPKLKKLTFENFEEWKEWEDITPEEEAFSIMPCLKKLKLECCPALTALPHRLLRKASSLEILKIVGSKALERYGNKDDSDAKLVSLNNPHLNLTYHHI